MVLKWDDQQKAFAFKKMRKNCPCANCAGEKDVFGNIYKGPKQVITENSYVLMEFNHRILCSEAILADGHHSGIYSFTLMRNLSN